MEKTLGELLSDPRIRKLAPDAIRKWDLSGEEMWKKTLTELREEHFGGEIREGLERLYAAADSSLYRFPIWC